MPTSVPTSSSVESLRPSDRQHLEALRRSLLPDDVLARIHERAPQFDRDNAFFKDDLAELQQTGYLKVFVPVELGGSGLGIREVAWLQQRLAEAAPATALGVNMHLVWTGVAHALAARGDDSHRIVLEEAAAGEVFAFGVSEAGNDFVLTDSGTVAEPQPDGSYRFTGTKIFTSMSPAWTRLGTFGRDDSDPAHPELVYGFIDRDDADREGSISNPGEWDMLGMRATWSQQTRLDHALVRRERVTRTFAPGSRSDALLFAINANFQLLIAAVYAGLGSRALRLAADALRARHSKKTGGTYAELPAFRDRIAAAAARFERVPEQIAAVTSDFDALVDVGPAWFRRFVGTKLHAVEVARETVTDALRCAGGAGFANSSELARLHRDATAGMFHPASWDNALALFASQYLDDDFTAFRGGQPWNDTQH